MPSESQTTADWLALGRSYLAANVAESGANVIIEGLCGEIIRLREVKVLDSDQYDISDKLTDLQNERDWALADVERLRARVKELEDGR